MLLAKKIIGMPPTLLKLCREYFGLFFSGYMCRKVNHNYTKIIIIIITVKTCLKRQRSYLSSERRTRRRSFKRRGQLGQCIAGLQRSHRKCTALSARQQAELKLCRVCVCKTKTGK